MSVLSPPATSHLAQMCRAVIQAYVAGFDDGYNAAIRDIINPPNIVKFTDSGFDINMNNMKVNAPCIITFDGSTYAMWKDIAKSLVMVEVG